MTSEHKQDPINPDHKQGPADELKKELTNVEPPLPQFHNIMQEQPLVMQMHHIVQEQPTAVQVQSGLQEPPAAV